MEYSVLMKEIMKFLRELQDNNNREWFNANKSRYIPLKAEFDVFVGELIERTARFDEEVKGLAIKDCVYRIYRDVRFSPNKEPYKVYFSAFIAARGGRNSNRGGYYVHVQPDGSLLAGGIYCPEPGLLKRLRQDIYDNVDEFKGILNDPVFVKEFGTIKEEGKLKKVPTPFSKDFPDADLLKHKNYTIESRKPDVFFESGDVLEQTASVFEKMYQFNRFLNYTVENI